MAFAAVAILNAPSSICGASASHGPPSDYCYQTDIAFTYSGSGTVTNEPVRIEINADGMIDSGQLDPRAWDFKPILGSFANEIAVEHQSLTSSASPWWFVIPSISAGETRTVRGYSGNGEHRRDQGVFFNGGELITAGTAAALDVTDNLQIDIEMQVLTSTARNQVILVRLAADKGYAVWLRSIGSALNLSLFLDNGACHLVWDPSWTGVRSVFTFTYFANAGIDTEILRDGVSVKTCDIDQGQIDTVSTAFDVGSSASTFFLNDVLIHDMKISEAGTELAHWGFDPDSMTETVATNPYQGTIADYSANGLTATYTFDRDQADWDYTIGATQLVSGSTQITLPDSNPDVLGPAFGSLDPSLSPAESTSGIFYNVFVNKWVSLSPVRSFGYVVVLGVFGLLFALLTYKLTKQVVIAFFIFGFPFAIGVGNGWVPAWWLILWLVLVFGGWFAQRQAESPS